jgi:dUTP pyrophosphatase
MITDSNKVYNTGYYMHPRSSVSKTKLRLANATGIIDSGYRGHLMGMFDLINLFGNEEYAVEKYDRLLQICAPGLVPIVVEIVNTFEELGSQTERGSGGFGSTGR